MPAASPGASDQLPAQFFSELEEAFDLAQTQEGIQRVSLRIGRRPLTLEFAGPSLVDLIVPALRHRRVSAPGPGAFTVKVFDSTSTSVTVPPPPWGPNDYLAQGEISGFNTDRFRTAFRVDAGCLSMIDLERRVAVFWIRDPAAFPRWMEAAPLRTLLGWWAAGQGLQMAHGAAVGTGDAGLLITARGGSGKSTSALRCLRDGLLYAGDDYVVVDPIARRVHSVYCTAKADDAAIDGFFPDLRASSHGRIVGDGSNKHVFFLDELYPEQISDLPLTALAVPALTGADTSGFAMSGAADALRALAPTTLFQLAGTGTNDFRLMAELVKTLPVYRLEVSANDGIAATVRRLLETAAGVPA